MIEALLFLLGFCLGWLLIYQYAGFADFYDQGFKDGLGYMIPDIEYLKELNE